MRAPPLTLLHSASVLEALTLMHDAAVSSIALVDATGAIVANFSMTDIKVRSSRHRGTSRESRAVTRVTPECKDTDSVFIFSFTSRFLALLVVATPLPQYIFRQQRLYHLAQSCQAFAQEVQLIKDRENNFQTKVPVFRVTSAATLRRVIGALCATHTHRIWVTAEGEQSGVPIAVVTLSDVLRVLAPFVNAHFASAPRSVFTPVTFVTQEETHETI